MHACPVIRFVKSLLHVEGMIPAPFLYTVRDACPLVPALCLADADEDKEHLQSMVQQLPSLVPHVSCLILNNIKFLSPEYIPDMS